MKEHKDNSLSRRKFLLASAFAGGGLILPISATAQNSMPMQATTPPAPDESGAADVTLRIGPVLVDVTKDKTISTVGYNGQVPGPLIRMPEGKPISVQVYNDTDTPEFVHWHGQFIPSEVDGAGEEKSIVIPPRGQVRYQFTPRPSGLLGSHFVSLPSESPHGFRVHATLRVRLSLAGNRSLCVTESQCAEDEHDEDEDDSKFRNLHASGKSPDVFRSGDLLKPDSAVLLL